MLFVGGQRYRPNMYTSIINRYQNRHAPQLHVMRRHTIIWQTIDIVWCIYWYIITESLTNMSAVMLRGHVGLQHHTWQEVHTCAFNIFPIQPITMDFSSLYFLELLLSLKEVKFGRKSSLMCLPVSLSRNMNMLGSKVSSGR